MPPTFNGNASELGVRLTHYPDRLCLTVTDDGRGIAGCGQAERFVAQGHFGLAGMRERAAMIGGRLDVQSELDYGTAVILELPDPIKSGEHERWIRSEEQQRGG